MASHIVPQCGQGGGVAASQLRLPPALIIFPPSVTKTEAIDYDVYTGPSADLIAVGLVRADQFPPKGRKRIAYLDGKEVRGCCRMDETYLRVEQMGDRARVRVGLGVDIAKARRAADVETDEVRHALRVAELKSKEAAAAEEALRVVLEWTRRVFEPMPNT